jgi:hypothetical protein
MDLRFIILLKFVNYLRSLMSIPSLRVGVIDISDSSPRSQRETGYFENMALLLKHRTFWRYECQNDFYSDTRYPGSCKKKIYQIRVFLVSIYCAQYSTLDFESLIRSLQ